MRQCVSTHQADCQSAFQRLSISGLAPDHGIKLSGGRLDCAKHAQVYEMGASIIHEENKYFR